MNYEKIGKFISNKRKEKGLTQEELASKLNITARAVSRWERGKGCPDISLLESLSNILDVQVLELLHGESVKNVQDKVILDILRLKNRETIIWKIIAYIFLNILLIIFIFILTISHYATEKIDINKERNISVIISPSMEPNFNMYDIVIIQKRDIKDVQVNDVVAYFSENEYFGENVIIHRVIDIDKKNSCLITKGDANYEIDNECVKDNNLIGVVSDNISCLGELLILFSHVGVIFKLCILLAIFGILFLDFIPIKSFIQKRK